MKTHGSKQKMGPAAVIGAVTLLGAAWLGSAAVAQTSCGIASSAATCGIDSSGCEIRQGIGLVNNCNASARGDGTSFWVTHGVNNNPASSSFQAGGTGSSSFVSLYCSDSSNAVFKGLIKPGESKSCPAGVPVPYAFRSFCGPNSECQNK